MLKVRFMCEDGAYGTEHCAVIKIMGHFAGKDPLLNVVAHIINQLLHVQFVHDSNSFNLLYFDSMNSPALILSFSSSRSSKGLGNVAPARKSDF